MPISAPEPTVALWAPDCAELRTRFSDYFKAGSQPACGTAFAFRSTAAIFAASPGMAFPPLPQRL